MKQLSQQLTCLTKHNIQVVILKLFQSVVASLFALTLSSSVLTPAQAQEANHGLLDATKGNLIAQAYKVNFSTYYLSTTTDSSGFFSVAHGLPSTSGIYGLQVSVQHANGNWHTLEYSYAVDNRFWFNSQHVQGVIGAPNFYNRPVRIVLTVYP